MQIIRTINRCPLIRTKIPGKQTAYFKKDVSGTSEIAHASITHVISSEVMQL